MRYWFNSFLALAVCVCALGQQPNDHIFPAAAIARPFINFDSKGFLVHGRRTFIVSAGIEYARVPRALWADRLMRLQRAGFNCVEVYTFWNFHEPREGVFEFGGDHDLGAFLKLVQRMGMYAIVRVGPYYCAEWDNGGYPLWLKFKAGLRVREPNAVFEQCVGRFFDRLLPIVASNQICYGGAVILVQLENEHPLGWGTDMPNDYFRWLRSAALSHGIVVPYFFSGLHHDSDPAGDAANFDDTTRPNPWMSTEFWSVWYNGYGSGEKEAKLYERRTWKIIAHGGNGYNYYMAHGGSNFGYTNNDEDAASYDYGAAVGEGGDLRPIYYSMKRAAFFARSLAPILENSVGSVDSTPGRRVSVRKGPAGEIDFYDSAGEIFPFVRDFMVGGERLKGNTVKIFGIVSNTLVVYGEAGSKGKLYFSSGELAVDVPSGMTVGTYHFGGLRVLVMNKEMADRCWVIGENIVCGPRYVGEVSRDRMVVEGGSFAIVFTPTGSYRMGGHGPVGVMDGQGVLGEWKRGGAALDDDHWLHSEQPLQMGADGDTTADAWYRVSFSVIATGDYTLLVEGADRATAFLDGAFLGPVAIKDGQLPLHLAAGGHRLLVFTAHDGRDKLAAYLGPLDSVARKGLFGRALLVKGGPMVKVLEDWEMSVGDSTSWRPYKIGDDAFGKKKGFGWFRTVLPALPPGARAFELRFASVDENATVYVNGRQVVRHEGWNKPFHVVIDRADTMRQPMVLTVFVENYSNEGGIDQPVRYSPWVDPVEIAGWDMRGGALSGGDSGPCWWRGSYILPVDSGWRPVWRVIPKGLGHGSIWVNGHNLGRYPEKIPVNGLYIPECWLREGKNDLVIFDEDGKDARDVLVEAETAASRSVTVLRRAGVAAYVDPLIGTSKSAAFTRWGNEGGTYPGAVGVSGFIQLTPDRYDYHDSTIRVFSCKEHHSGFPNGSSGRFFVMPLAADTLSGGRPFSHEEEWAEPGYYRVRLTDDGTIVEATARGLSGVFRIHFGSAGRFVFVGDTVGTRFSFSAPVVSSRVERGGMVYGFAVAEVEVRIDEGGGFDEVLTDTRRDWDRALGVVSVDDEDDRAKVIFYTALYHSLLLPWIVNDRGEYGGFSPWDSYRSLHPLLSLLYPEKQSGILRSLMDRYRQTGYLPTETMTGDHSIAIIVDAYLKGIRGIDKQEAYEAMMKSLVRGPFLQADRKVYREMGYIPSRFPESATRTVEYGYDDWVLAQYARQVMRDTAAYRLLMRGGMAYRRLLYVPSMLLLPRDGDSFRVRPGNSGYKEGDAWVYSYFVPQDVAGLADRMGGARVFAARLDSALRDGRIVFDNETVEHVPYLFAAAGQPSLTEDWVHRIVTERYGDGPGGLPGNDDLGAMSSWYVFSAMGFYPVCPGKPVYTLGVPLFRRVVVRVGAGRQLEIVRGSGRYVQSVLFNGKQVSELPHALLVQGGRLEFRMGDSVRKRVLRRSGMFVTGVELSSVEVNPGEWNTVRFVVRNRGDTGVMRVVVEVDGKIVAAKNCLVASGTILRDSISFRLYRPGVVRALVGGVPVRVVVRKPSGMSPADVEVGELGMRAVVPVGEGVEVNYSVKNIGWEERRFVVPLLVDDRPVGMDTVYLGPGEEKDRIFNWKADSMGWHSWKVGGQGCKIRVYGSPEEAVVLDGMPDRSGWGNDTRWMGNYGWIPGSRSLDDLGERLTMVVWVYPESTHRGLMDIFTNGDTHVLQVVGGRSLSFFAGGWGRGDCTVDLPADWVGHWHQIAGVCDRDGLRVYIDGKQRGYTPLEKSVHLFGGGNTWMIGGNEEFPGQRMFEGRVNRPMIYQEALPAAAIYNLYIKQP